jgi:FMN phosphatase YigB (HAD superfamily)
MAARRVDFVLFDLGGVLIDPGGVGPMRELSGIGSDEELWTRWLSCRWVRAFEAGRCTPEQFAAGVVDDWDLDLEPAAFLEEFAGWPGTPYPGALELVAAVRETVPFGLRFLSFELGMVKPDHEIFRAVAEHLPAPPDRVLFLDDNAANVDAAAETGFVGRHVRGVEATRHALVAQGVVAG